MLNFSGFLWRKRTRLIVRCLINQDKNPALKPEF